MKSWIQAIVLTLLTFSFPLLANANAPAEPTQNTKPAEIVNFVANPEEQPSTPPKLSDEDCIKSMEECPEEGADFCKATLVEKNGCVFKPGQVFNHKQKYTLYNEEQCTGSIKKCPFPELCKAELEKHGCQFTPEQLKAPQRTIEELEKMVTMEFKPDPKSKQPAPEPTPENCAKAKEQCKKGSAELCKLFLKKIGCPFE